jgi:hypothetical protein
MAGMDPVIGYPAFRLDWLPNWARTEDWEHSAKDRFGRFHNSRPSPRPPPPAAGLGAAFSPFWRRPALLAEDRVVGEDVEQGQDGSRIACAPRTGPGRRGIRSRRFRSRRHRRAAQGVRYAAQRVAAPKRARRPRRTWPRVGRLKRGIQAAGCAEGNKPRPEFCSRAARSPSLLRRIQRTLLLEHLVQLLLLRDARGLFGRP